MEEYAFDQITGIGVMPSGEIRIFKDEASYYQAYTDEESEIYDEMYRLNNGFELDYDYDALQYA